MKRSLIENWRVGSRTTASASRCANQSCRSIFLIASLTTGGHCLKSLKLLVAIGRNDARLHWVKLTTREDERENLRVMLLADIQKVFTGEWPPPPEGQLPVSVERIFSKDLIEKLAEMRERPWSEICRGRPITRAMACPQSCRFRHSVRQH